MIPVIHICQRDDAATGGAARVAVELTKHLTAFGVSCQCLFVYGEPGPFGDELGDRARYLGFSSGRQAIFHGAALSRFIATTRPRILHHHDGLTWTHMLTLGVRGVPKIGHGHLSPPGKDAPLRAKLANWIHRFDYDHLICVSRGTGEDWAARGFPRERITVVPNGVDAGKFRPPSERERADLRARWDVPPRSRVVGFVGRLHSRMKGCDDFIRTIAALPPGFVGVMAGAGPDRDALEALARQLGVESRIRFLGNVNVSEDAYWGFDVFLMTSHIEPFGLVLLEATSCGLPAIVLPAEGGVIELGENVGAAILQDRDPTRIAAAVVSKVEEVLGGLDTQSARTRSLQRFTWEKAAESVAGVYRHLIA